MSFSATLEIMARGLTVEPGAIAESLTALIDGLALDDQAARFLTLLNAQGVTAQDLAAAATILRARAIPVKAPPHSADCCGTGGDGLNTYNVSTAVALTAAACGLPIAKHGNRSASSQSGAGDILEALGVNLNPPVEKLEFALQTLNFAFLMAPNHHPALAKIAPVRQSLGVRTIFNLLGPLINPAKVSRQLVGVYDKKYLLPMAEALHLLGSRAAWIVHSHDGLDEISIAAPTDIAILKNGLITFETLTPDDFGLPYSDLADLRGGDASTNAQALMNILSGRNNTYRHCVIANTAALLYLCERHDTLIQAAQAASAALDKGNALSILKSYRNHVAKETL